MNDNEFYINGVKYSAVEATRSKHDNLISCDGCELERFECSMLRRPKCNKGDRLDGRDVIFVEKHP